MGHVLPRQWLGLIVGGLVLTSLWAGSASAGVLIGPPGGPKYLTCPHPAPGGSIAAPAVKDCNEDFDYSTNDPNTARGCLKFCTKSPLRFTADKIQACPNEPVTVNVSLDTNLGSGAAIVLDPAKGNEIRGGEIDWGDGTPPDQIWSGQTVNATRTHSYAQAATYYPSAVYWSQFKYHGQGACSFLCDVQDNTKVTVYLATSSQCTKGKFEAVKPKAKPKSAK